jgi:uncharacterized protein (DUF983 family)
VATVTRQLVLTALERGLRKRCPHCGRGRLFSRAWTHVDACPYCGLVYEKNPGDTWAFTVIGDRIPIGLIIAIIYFGLGAAHRTMALAIIAVIAVLVVWTAPNRWGAGIALHYLSRVVWRDPQDPVPDD